MKAGWKVMLVLPCLLGVLSINVRAGEVPVLEASSSEEQLPDISQYLTLAQAVDLALMHNLDLRIERTLVDDAQQNHLIAKSEFDPAATSGGNSNFRVSPGASSQLDGSAQPELRSAGVDMGLETKLPTGATMGLTADILDRSKTNSSFRLLNPVFDTALRLQVRQPILKNAGFRYNLSTIRLARLSIDETNFQLLASLLELIRDTEIGYWDVVAAEAELEITRRSIELSELLLEEATERKKVNLATQTDVLEAQSSLAERQEFLLRTEANVEAARDSLFQTLGLLREVDPMGPGFEALPPRVFLECVPQESFDNALNYAPSLQVALIQSQRRAEEVSRQKNQLLPQVDLTASTGILGQAGSFSNAHDSLQDVDGHFWDAGFQVRIPLGNRLERARLAQARNALNRAKMTEDNLKLDLYALVRAACRDVELARKSYEASEITVRFSELRLEQLRETLNQGQITIRDVLEAQNSLDSARFRRVQARVQELRAIVQLAEVEGTLPARYGLSFGPDTDS